MGFINQQGEELVAPLKYDLVDDFTEGYARVSQNDKFGFINTLGEEVIPCEYESAWNFSEGLAAVNKKGKWGFINYQNEVVVDFVFENTAIGFNEGFCGVVNSNKMGFINKAGTLQIPCIYDASLIINECYFDFRNGYCPVKLVNTEKHIYINYDGNQLGGVFDLAYGFTEKMGLVVNRNKWGYMNTEGNLSIPCKYQHAGLFSNGVGIVKIN